MSDASSKYFLGIDGGGTKTSLCLIDEKLNIINEVVGGPSSLDAFSIEEITTNILSTYSKLNFLGTLTSVFAGIGGISNNNDIKIINSILRNLPGATRETIISSDNDVINALMGSLGHLNGMVLIIGTGSVCFGIYDNNSWRSGGYSYKEGDPGSSYDLGIKSLQYLAKVIDGRLAASPFSFAISEKINAHDFVSLANVFNSYNRTEIASLSSLVTKHSDEIIARAIIDNATSEVALMVEAVYNKLERKPTELGIIGGLGNSDTLYKKILIEKLKKIANFEIVSPPRHSASYGSALKAYEKFTGGKYE